MTEGSSGSLNRKRKGSSPAKPEAKRAAASAARGRPGTQSGQPIGRPGAKTASARGSNKQTAASTQPAEEQTWEQVAEECGWDPEACLSHRLVFKKKEDAKVLKETLLQYIRRLRALGKHLLGETHRLEKAAAEMRAALEEEQSRSYKQQAANKETVDRLSGENSQMAEKLAALEQQLQEKVKECSAVQATLVLEQNGAAQARQEVERLAGECRSLQEQLAEAKKQICTATELHQHAQKYNAQLQEYNSKLQTDLQAASTKHRSLQEEKNTWAEESAGLRGSTAALEAQLAAAQKATAAAEEARQLAVGDASRLRGEADQVTKQRDHHQQAAALLQQELSRYKDCTGKNIESLEKEKASKALLESQNKAQVEFNSELRDDVAKLQAQLAMAKATADRQGAKAAEVEVKKNAAEASLAVAEQKLREGEVLRRKLHNTILELKGNIRVFCRVRPLSLENPTTESLDGKPLIQFPASSGDFEAQGLELAVSASSGQQPASHKFSFDRVFGPSSHQEEVFEEISQLVQSALDGYKVCIFAYGQTGSGKTYTMVGPPGTEHRGVIPRAVQQLFDASRQMEAQGWAFEMKASMVEIYNEEIRDLIGKGPPSGKKHQISHDDKGTAVSFVEAVDCKRPEKVRDLLAKATRMRSVGATAANEQSSRSHMVFSLAIVGVNDASGQQINGVLNLIDLAGSERLSKSLATGERLKETQAINKSLSALGDVILALGNKENHVPFRNSKLTYLLQPCLGGDAKTLMFVNVAPTVDAANESLCSLRFAAKVNATEIGTARRHIASKS